MVCIIDVKMHSPHGDNLGLGMGSGGGGVA